MKKQPENGLLGYNSKAGIIQYIQRHVEKYNYLMSVYVAPELTLLEKMMIAADFAFCVVRYGVGINDYFQYNFYKRKANDRESFIVGRKWRYIIKKCNGKINVEEFDNKAVFNEEYSTFLGRDWIDMDICSFEEFCEFVNDHDKVICKIKNGSGGNGIQLIEKDSWGSPESKYSEIKNQHCVLEEVIIQYDAIAAFNPSSVNSIRVVTIVSNGEVRIMHAVFRMGNGSLCTDNFHHLGLAALIDVETGIVYTPAVDKLNRRYIVHPISGKQITGFVVPFWDHICETVKKAALINPDIKYVGWDVALEQDGTACIIEGNCASDPDVVQMPDQIGKWSVYKEAIKAF